MIDKQMRNIENQSQKLFVINDRSLKKFFLLFLAIILAHFQFSPIGFFYLFYGFSLSLVFFYLKVN